MDDFDLTQPLSFGYEDENPILENNESATLRIPLQDGIPEELAFPLHNGVNKIGRKEYCEVCIKNKVLSKEHAVIEVGGDCFLIYDLNSFNKTWKSKKPLKPNVKYKLDPNDEIKFGNIKAQFIIKQNSVEEDSGSETGSESMLLLNEEYAAFSVSTPIKKNEDVNENCKDTSGNASTSNALFPKNASAVEAKKASSPKLASPILENEPTQMFYGANLSDSGDETDCEDHSAEKIVTKEKETRPLNSDNVPKNCEEISEKRTTVNETCIIKTVDHSAASTKSPKKSTDQNVEDRNLVGIQLCETNFINKHQKEPECQFQENDSLPATQLNFALADYAGVNDSRKKKSAKKLNNEPSEKPVGSLDSLPETQPNTRNYGVNFEIPESPPPEPNDDLPATQLSSGPVINNIGGMKNNICKKKATIFISDDETGDSDDLPPTQPNLALQFSEEMNFLQRDEPQGLHNKNASSPQASTSANTSYSRTAVPPSSSFSGSKHRKSKLQSKASPGKSPKGSSVVNTSSKVPLLSCINISVEEGSSLAEDSSSILCPSTQRRSDVSADHKIRNTDINCSPNLSRGSVKKDNVAETPPHLLKESTLGDGISCVITSLAKRLSEVSPPALNDSSISSHSRSKITSTDLHDPSHSGVKTPKDPHVLSTPGKTSTPGDANSGKLKVATPDSAKAGDLNYSVNYSPKVYKTKLNDLDRDSQESVGVLKNLDKEFKNLEPTDEPSAEKEEIPLNEDRPDSGNEDAGKGKKKKKRGKRPKAAQKEDDHRSNVGKNTSSKRLSPDSSTDQKRKKSKADESINLPDLSSDQHSNETGDVEDGINYKTSQRRKSRRHPVTSTKDANLESDILKKSRIESRNNDEIKEQSATYKSDAENPILVETSSTSSISAGVLKSSVNKSSPKKKTDKNDNVQQLPTRKSKRQKMILNEKSGEDSDQQDAKAKAVDDTDPRNDFENILPRKSARKKLLQNEQDNDISLSNQDIGFCAFRRNEPVEGAEDSLLDSRMLKRRKGSPLRGNSKRISPFKEQSSKLPQLRLNESEVSVSSSGEQCNITVQDEGLVVVENSNSNEKISSDSNSSGRRSRRVHGIPKLSISVQRLPLTPQQSTRTRRQGHLDESEMQKETEVAAGKKGNRRGKRQVSQSKQVNKKGAPQDDSTKEVLPSKVPLDTSVKTDDGERGLKKDSHQRRPAPRSRRAQEKEELLCNNPEDSISAASLNSSARSLRLRLSASDASADEKPDESEKRPVSIFSKDSVKSLIKLDARGLGSSKVDNLEIKPSRASRKSKFTEEEEEGASENESPKAKKNTRMSRSVLNSKDDVSSPPAAKKNKRNQSSNSSSVSDSVSDKGTTPAKSKRTGNAKSKNEALLSPNSRQQHQAQKPKVMFTKIEDEEPQKVVVTLGGKVVEDVNLCTHLVADKLRRTVKALCCIAKGIPLVNTKWIQECKKSDSFVDHSPYLIKDKAAEKQYKFELQKTLQKATEKPLLSSWSIHVTPNVMPSPEQMKDIIQCAGGKYLPKMPNRLSEKTVIIACAPDLNLCSHAIKCGIPVLGPEFILTGLLQYKTDMKSYTLSKN